MPERRTLAKQEIGSWRCMAAFLDLWSRDPVNFLPMAPEIIVLMESPCTGLLGLGMDQIAPFGFDIEMPVHVIPRICSPFDAGRPFAQQADIVHQVDTTSSPRRTGVRLEDVHQLGAHVDGERFVRSPFDRQEPVNDCVFDVRRHISFLRKGVIYLFLAAIECARTRRGGVEDDTIDGRWRWIPVGVTAVVDSRRGGGYPGKGQGQGQGRIEERICGGCVASRQEIGYAVALGAQLGQRVWELERDFTMGADRVLIHGRVKEIRLRLWWWQVRGWRDDKASVVEAQERLAPSVVLTVVVFSDKGCP